MNDKQSLEDVYSMISEGSNWSETALDDHKRKVQSEEAPEVGNNSIQAAYMQGIKKLQLNTLQADVLEMALQNLHDDIRNEDPKDVYFKGYTFSQVMEVIEGISDRLK